jgi:hypothetical protein
MLGLILFLLCVLIVCVIVKMILAEVLPGNTNAVKIAMLLVLLMAVLWLSGFGGWPHVYGWRP